MKTIRSQEYQVSERVRLEVGDGFRASGGPYWKSRTGEKIRLQSRGPYVFLGHVRKGAVEWIEAVDKDGCFTVLHIAGRRKRIDAALVARPYRVTGKKRRLDNNRQGR